MEIVKYVLVIQVILKLWAVTENDVFLKNQRVFDLQK